MLDSHEGGLTLLIKDRDHKMSFGINLIEASWTFPFRFYSIANTQDQGIALLPTFIVGNALQQGQLRTVLTDYKSPDITLCALYPRHRHLSAKVRFFVELLAERLGDRPYWDLVQ